MPWKEVGQLDEHEVAEAVAVDVVHALEVVEVEHEHGDRVVRLARAVQLGAEPVVEVAMERPVRESVWACSSAARTWALSSASAAASPKRFASSNPRLRSGVGPEAAYTLSAPRRRCGHE